MSAPLIEAHHLAHRRGDKAILRDISLQLEPGCTIGLIGRTGAGKTTLLRCMLGLAFADSGEATVLGERATQLSTSAKSRLGYVTQTPDLPPDQTVGGLVRLVASWQPRWEADWAATLVARFHLGEFAKVGKLSVGEQQLLALVLALGHKPDLLVLDEPVSSLDPVMRRTVAATLADLQAERQTSILFSTHILSDLERLATHIAVIEDGHISLHREVDSIRQDIARWQIHARHTSLPGTLAAAGVLRYRTDGTKHAVALVDTGIHPDPALLAAQLDAQIDPQTIGLEDFVVEYLQ